VSQLHAQSSDEGEDCHGELGVKAQGYTVTLWALGDSHGPWTAPGADTTQSGIGVADRGPTTSIVKANLAPSHVALEKSRPLSRPNKAGSSPRPPPVSQIGLPWNP
jgi:hypothetical protein